MTLAIWLSRTYPQYAFTAAYTSAMACLCVGIVYAIMKRPHFVTTLIATILLAGGAFEIEAITISHLGSGITSPVSIFVITFLAFFFLAYFLPFGAFDATAAFYGLLTIFFLLSTYPLGAWQPIVFTVIAFVMGTYSFYIKKPKHTPIVLAAACIIVTSSRLSSLILGNFSQEPSSLIAASLAVISLATYLIARLSPRKNGFINSSFRKDSLGSFMRTHPSLVLALVIATVIYGTAGLIFFYTLLKVETTLAWIFAEAFILLGLVAAPIGLTRVYSMF